MIGTYRRILPTLPATLVVAGGLLVSALCAAAEGEVPPEDQCAVCHFDLDDEAIDVAAYFKVDIHARAGLSCVDCHGGDATSDDEDIAMSEEAGFIGSPSPTEHPDFCAKCHSDAGIMRRFNPGLPVDQLALYRTSTHGRRNADGDENVATCVSCHSVHDIRPASEPRSTVHPTRVAETCAECHSDSDLMSDYGLPTDQLDDYVTSVHWKMISEGNDLSAPTCNDCHGNHGALPPEVEYISGVCGHCHVKNREFFSQSPKKEIFEEEELPECETCHGNHGVQHPTGDLLGLHDDAICSDCHDDDDSDESNAILRMKASLDSLHHAIDASHEVLNTAIQKGMHVTDAEFKWRDARQKLLEARTAIHLFSPEPLSEVVGEGLTLAAEVETDSEGAISEYGVRRRGLLFSTLIITVLAVALYLKIRQIEGR